MRLSILFFVFLVLIPVVVSPVLAEDDPGNISIQFSDMNAFNPNLKILVYDGFGSEIGEFNSTDRVTLNSSMDYLVMFKPGPSDWFNHPLNAVQLLLVGLPVTISYGLFLGVIAVIILVVIMIAKKVF